MAIIAQTMRTSELQFFAAITKNAKKCRDHSDQLGAAPCLPTRKQLLNIISHPPATQLQPLHHPTMP
jgi:hypothetical protein